MGNFERLEVWSDAKALAVLIYKITDAGSISTDYGLKDQIRRAAVSIPSNIAEGEESGRNKRSINYFYISKGSLAELTTQIIISFEIGYLNNEAFNDFMAKSNSLSAKLRKFIQYRERAGFDKY